jgi:hypothetical protein
MRRTTAWLFALILILCLTACKQKSSEKATPGNLATPTPYSPRIAAETTDVSGEYAERLCSYPWMETYDMTYYCFYADGSYRHFNDQDLTETIDSGKWQMKRDANVYMALHMEVDGG